MASGLARLVRLLKKQTRMKPQVSAEAMRADCLEEFRAVQLASGGEWGYTAEATAGHARWVRRMKSLKRDFPDALDTAEAVVREVRSFARSDPTRITDACEVLAERVRAPPPIAREICDARWMARFIDVRVALRRERLRRKAADAGTVPPIETWLRSKLHAAFFRRLHACVMLRRAQQQLLELQLQRRGPSSRGGPAPAPAPAPAAPAGAGSLSSKPHTE